MNKFTLGKITLVGGMGQSAMRCTLDLLLIVMRMESAICKD